MGAPHRDVSVASFLQNGVIQASYGIPITVYAQIQLNPVSATARN